MQNTFRMLHGENYSEHLGLEIGRMLEGGVWVVLRKPLIEFGRHIHIPTKPMDVSEGSGEIEGRKRAE